jgi:tryptophanyl-tRNA synthetase
MVKEMSVTPYEVKGEIDYERLITEFGVEKISSALLERIKKHTKDIHFMLRRGIFFAHRDMNWLLDEYEKGNKFFLYTGRGPSGGTHIGHLMPWVFTKWLQDKFGVELYFQFTDDEKFMYKEDLTLEQANKYAYENALDVIALGFDARKTHFIIDSEQAGVMYPLAIKIAKKITFSTVKAAFGFTEDMNIGSIFYTAMQATPAVLPSVLKGKNIPCLIPLGIDQDPHFRVARDVYQKLGFCKPALIHGKMMPGLKEGGKMSASDPNTTIYTSDTPEQVKEKIIKHAFSGGRGSLAEHKKYGGNPDIDVCYQWLCMFFEPDDKKLEKIYNDYKSGKLLTSELKAYTIEKINAFLKAHQANREKAKKQIDKILLKV